MVKQLATTGEQRRAVGCIFQRLWHKTEFELLHAIQQSPEIRSARCTAYSAAGRGALCRLS